MLGFSEQLTEAFFRPFLAGIRLRRDLLTSAAVALFDLNMLVRGRAALPSRGMRALPDALAAGLPPRTTRLATPVLELIIGAADGPVLGVRTTQGELRGSAVVLATAGDSTAGLTGSTCRASSLAAPRSTWPAGSGFTARSRSS